MSEPLIISALVRKRAELSGEYLDLEKRRNVIRTKIVHIDSTLRLFGYEGDPSDIAPRIRRKRMFRRGELIQLTFAILRQTGTDLCNRDIAEEIVRRKELTGGEDMIGRIMDGMSAVRRRHGR